MVVVAAVLAVGVVSCTDETSDDSATPRPSSKVPSDEPIVPAPLPFGLQEVAGTTPVGRPLLFDHVSHYYNDEPVTARSFSAAFTVMADEPEDVFGRWTAQLGALEVDAVTVWRGDGALLTATGHTMDRPDGDWFQVELWTTGAEPILLVNVERYGGSVPGDPVVTDSSAEPGSSPSITVDDVAKGPGDILFVEQRDAILVPEGARTLLPVMPTAQGTGGSMSVLAAVDGPAAVRDLLDQARVYGADSGEVTEPVETEVDGTHVIDAAFAIHAGGWGFDVTSVQAPDDPYATVYVRSWAD